MFITNNENTQGIKPIINSNIAKNDPAEYSALGQMILDRLEENFPEAFPANNMK